MSYCEIIFFENGIPKDSVEFRNSWGGAAFIWDALFDKYLKDPNKKYDTWIGNSSKGDRRLWDLAKRADIPMFMRAVHVSTFDRAIVRQEHFAEFAGHLREFVRYFDKGDKVCHLDTWANLIESSNAEAIGFYGTSVSENLWYEWDDENEDSVPYNLNTRDEHFEVYDWLNSIHQPEVEK